MKNLLQFFVYLITVLKINGADEVMYARVGDKVELNTPKLSENYYVNWFFEGQTELADATHVGRRHVYTEKLGDNWRGKLSVSPNVLTIENIQEENFGTISCKVRSSTTEPGKVKTFQLVKVLVSLKETLPVIPGDLLSLNCIVQTNRKPSNKVYWMNPTGGTEIGVQGAVRRKAESHDNGEWTCVIEDSEKKTTFKLPVSVVDFSPASKHVYTSENLPLSVPFWITPKEFVQQIRSKIKTVQWLFTPKTSSTQQTIFSFSPKTEQLELGGQDRELSYKNFTSDGKFYLSRNQARVEDRGSYNCSITFTNGQTLSRSVVVEVLQIIPTPGTELISGHHLNLSCSTGGPLETDVRVKWFPPKTSSLAKADPSYGLLIIPRVGTEDSGKWRCELRQNTTVLTSAVITLKIDPILTVWMMVTICGAGVILILLLVLAFILFRRRQRKMRRFRHRLCQCKNPKPKGFYKA